MLYPLKFKPRIKERIWGGQAILKKKGKAASRLAKGPQAFAWYSPSGNQPLYGNGNGEYQIR